LQDITDTSPVRRGKRIREQLMCITVPPPPPNVKADAPPQGGAEPTCKAERYAEHRNTRGDCAGCHALMDPLGFGLEQFDRQGAFRSFDTDTAENSPTQGEPLTNCPISGDGELDGEKFNGPAGLADLLVQNDIVGPCVATQFYRFAMGRKELDDDMAAIAEYRARFKASGYSMQELLLSYVSSNAFGYRREETEQ
jgi:hypothetical protein